MSEAAEEGGTGQREPGLDLSADRTVFICTLKRTAFLLHAVAARGKTAMTHSYTAHGPCCT